MKYCRIEFRTHVSHCVIQWFLVHLAVGIREDFGGDGPVVLVRQQVLVERPGSLEAPRTEVALVAEGACVPSQVQPELPRVPEPLSADVAFERSLSSVPSDVHVEPDM